VPKGTQTVYLLVPGLLGYGWEWHDAERALRELPAAVTLVWPWDPWRSLAESGTALTEHLDYLLRRLPGSVARVVVIGHSAAGLLLLWAATRVQVPSSLAVELITVGAPLAGQGFNPWSGQDLWMTPLPIALGSRFSQWPTPKQGLKLRVFVTGPSDPVMTLRFGHNPGDSAGAAERSGGDSLAAHARPQPGTRSPGPAAASRRAGRARRSQPGQSPGQSIVRAAVRPQRSGPLRSVSSTRSHSPWRSIAR
jgi:hypothetical protein